MTVVGGDAGAHGVADAGGPPTPAGLTVVKIGGSLDLAAAEPLLLELAAWTAPLVIVHGAHAEMDRLAAALGHPPRMVTSERGELTRYTDRLTMDHFLMAYCGLVNKRLVEALRRLGTDAVGLSAMDGGIAVGRRKPDLRIVEGDRRRILRDNHAGTIEHIDTALLRLLLSSGRLPVLTPPAVSHDGEAINVDGDRLAAEIAIALGAARLLILMNVPGLLRDPDDPGSLLPRLRVDEIEAHLHLASGRARVKLLAARRALAGGVATVVLAGGGGERPLARALAGGGSWLGAAE
jgi:acetylglutamate/LysW-gamma-L-alpha-aminoadipate kinase